MEEKFIKIGDIGLFEVKLPFITIGSGEPRGLIVAMQHGSESASLLVIKRIIEEQSNIKGTAIILPIANPFGQIFGQRNEIIEGKDLNRAFPGKKEGDFTARLAESILSLCQNVDFIVDLHNFSRLSPVMAGYTKNKDKTQDKVLSMLSSFNPEVIWETDFKKNQEDGRFMGTLDNALAKIGKPSIFVETPNIFLVEDEQINKVKEGIFNVFKKFNQEPDEDCFNKIPKFSTKYFFSDFMGIFEPAEKPMTIVSEGQTIGKITLIPSFEEVEIKSPFSGTLLTIRSKEVVRTGSKLGSVGR